MNSFWSVSVFWIVAFLFVLGALALILPPLFRRKPLVEKTGRKDINIAVYRDQLKEMEADRRSSLLTDEQFTSAKVELEARLAQDALEGNAETVPASKGGRILGVSLALLVPLMAFGLYYKLGNPEAMLPQAAAVEQAGQAGQAGHDMAKMLASIEEKAKNNPEDGNSWFMLGKTYGALERWPEAEKALAKAAELEPKAAAVWSGYAEAVAINTGRNLSGKPMELVLKALSLDPRDQKGLELMGIGAFQEKKYAEAARYWDQLLEVIEPDTPYAEDIKAASSEAKHMAQGVAPARALDNLSEPHTPGTGGKSITGRLELAPALKDKVSPKDRVFIFARASSGGAPLAVLPVTADRLPMDFKLDDSLAMMPDNTLSKYDVVTLTARVSKGGGVQASPGDLEGQLASVKVGSEGVKLVIDKLRK